MVTVKMYESFLLVVVLFLKEEVFSFAPSCAVFEIEKSTIISGLSSQEKHFLFLRCAVWEKGGVGGCFAVICMGTTNPEVAIQGGILGLCKCFGLTLI
jgi:hypothetical protein